MERTLREHSPTLSLPLKQDEFLFFLQRSVLTVVEREWSRFIRSVLDRHFGPTYWTETLCRSLGRRSRGHLLSKQYGGKFDFYLLNEILVRFHEVFAERFPTSVMAGAERTTTTQCARGEQREKLIARKDKLRYNLCSLVGFRFQATHAMHLVSAREELNAFLCLRNLTSQLFASDDIDAHREECLNCGKPEHVEFPHFLPGDSKLESVCSSRVSSLSPGCGLMCTLRFAISVAARCHLASSRAQRSSSHKLAHQVSMPRLQANVANQDVFCDLLALLGYQLLCTVEGALQQPIQYVSGGEQSQLQQNTRKEKLELQAIGETLREALRGGSGESQRCRFESLLCKALNKQQGKQTMKTKRELFFSHFDHLFGAKCGLRNAIAHSKQDGYSVSALQSSFKSTLYILRVFDVADGEVRALQARLNTLLKHMRSRQLLLKNGNFNGQRLERNIRVQLISDRFPWLQNKMAADQDRQKIWLRLPPPPFGFVGREGVRREIINHIQARPWGCCVLIRGESGIGKSTLAASVAEELRAAYPLQFWFSAAMKDTLELAMKQAAAVLDPSSAVEHAREVLHHIEQPLLLILDDVQDPLLVKSFVPHKRHCVIITTTTKATFPELKRTQKKCSVGEFTLHPLALSDSLHLLCAGLTKVQRYVFERLLSQSPLEVINWVKNVLGNNPVALELAVGLLRKLSPPEPDLEKTEGKSVVLKKTRDLVCGAAEDVNPYRCLISRDFNDSVFLLASRVSPGARRVLEALCVLGGLVPWEQLAQTVEKVGSCHYLKVQSKATSLEQIYSDFCRGRRSELLQELTSVGLVSKISAGGIVRVHQLVLNAVLKKTKESPSVRSAQICQGLAFALLMVSAQPGLVPTPANPNTFAFSLHSMLEQVFENAVGLSQQSTVAMATWLARGYYSLLLDAKQAGVWYKTAICMEERGVGRKLVLADLSAELGAVLWRSGEPEEGVTALRRSLSLRSDMQENSARSSSHEQGISGQGPCKAQILEEISCALLHAGCAYRTIENAPYATNTSSLSIAELTTLTCTTYDYEECLFRSPFGSMRAAQALAGTPPAAKLTRLEACKQLFWKAVDLFWLGNIEHALWIMVHVLKRITLEAASRLLAEHTGLFCVSVGLGSVGDDDVQRALSELMSEWMQRMITVELQREGLLDVDDLVVSQEKWRRSIK